MSNELQVRETAQTRQLSELDNSLFSADKAPYYMDLAEKLSTSTMIPKAYIGKPMDLFVAMATGYKLGIPIEQAIQDIAVINGKPCLYGDGLLAVVMQHPEFDDIIEEPMMSGNTIIGYSCTVKRRGKADYTKIFTIDMAKKAGLLGKPGPWTQYQDRMLQMRARGFALRDRFPDALRGIKSREEVEDFIEGEIVPNKTSSQESSRTSRLKDDIKKRQGGIYEQPIEKNAVSTENNLSEDASGNTGAENSDETSNAVNADIKADNNAPVKRNNREPIDDSPDDSPITDDQIDLISSLLAESNDPERKDKAFKYFEITELTELTKGKAEKFIKLLNKG